jgi:hypothetical protein
VLPRVPGIVVALVALVAIGTACGGDDEVESDAERFCGEAATNTDLIVDPPISTEAELDATLDFYRLMGDLAPIAIAEQWGTLTTALETASSLVPGNETSEQEVAMTAYAAERSAYEVKVWLERNCGVDIPITTIAPQEPLPPPTTTLVPPDGATMTATSGAADE